MTELTPKLMDLVFPAAKIGVPLYTHGLLESKNFNEANSGTNGMELLRLEKLIKICIMY